MYDIDTQSGPAPFFRKQRKALVCFFNSGGAKRFGNNSGKFVFQFFRQPVVRETLFLFQILKRRELE